MQAAVAALDSVGSTPDKATKQLHVIAPGACTDHTHSSIILSTMPSTILHIHDTILQSVLILCAAPLHRPFTTHLLPPFISSLASPRQVLICVLVGSDGVLHLGVDAFPALWDQLPYFYKMSPAYRAAMENVPGFRRLMERG